MKKFLVNLSKRSIVCRNIIRKLIYIYRLFFYKIRTVGRNVDEKLIVFSCYAGEAYACSPKAIYEQMQKDKKYKDYKYVWAFKDVEKYRKLEKNKNTVVVEQGKKEYQKYLGKAKYWIINFKLPEHIYPKKDQILIQCWHGTPLKRLGFDLLHFDNVLNTMDGMKKRYAIEAKKFTYFLSPSKFASEKFISAWNLKGFGKENIIVEKGYPRNDFLYNYTCKDVDKIKKELGVETDKKIILYAPTYRSNQHESGLGYVYKEKVDFEKLKSQLEKDYIILFRPHYLVANAFDFEKYKGFIYNVSQIDDINELYIISDILITDYSSVFFDYANLRRPIIFHMYDLEHYRDESNGFYIDLDELPGKITQTDDELLKEIKKISKKFTYDKKYQKFNKKYNYLEDGEAAKRVIKECIK